MKRLLWLLLFVFAAQGQTLIQEVVCAGTAPFRGRILVIGPDMTTAAGRTVVRARMEISTNDRSISVSLEPNDIATPANTSY